MTVRKKQSDLVRFSVIVGLTVTSLLGGFMCATQPEGAGWRAPFSFHPFCMTVAFVGLMGSAASLKKKGGYVSTKIHGVLGSLSTIVAWGGIYAIYHNKNLMGKPHFTSTHSWVGLASVVGCLVVNVVGAVFLHPDFGISKVSRTIRSAHKLVARVFIALGWISCMLGLMQLTSDRTLWMLLGVPMTFFAPLTLL